MFLTMRILPISKRQNGDTIVEVLMAVAIVSTVLVGAFVATNRSSQTTRTAQERGEALKLAESQVELLKVAADTGTPDLATAPASFCISGGATPIAPSPGCTRGLYRVAITKPAASSYVTQVTWDSLSGGTNNIELAYKTQ